MRQLRHLERVLLAGFAVELDAQAGRLAAADSHLPIPAARAPHRSTPCRFCAAALVRQSWAGQIELQTGRRRDRPKRVVDDHFDVVRFAPAHNFLGLSDARRQYRDRRARIIDPFFFNHFAEFPFGVELLTRRNGHMHAWGRKVLNEFGFSQRNGSSIK